MAGGHADAREGRHVARGGWRVKGPRVSGPWFEYWGGNAKVLPHSTFYVRFSPLLLPCGTMFPRKSLLAGDMAAPWASDRIVRRPSRGLGSTRLSIKHVR